MNQDHSNKESSVDWRKLAKQFHEAINSSDIPELDEAFFRKAKIRPADGL